VVTPLGPAYSITAGGASARTVSKPWGSPGHTRRLGQRLDRRSLRQL